MRSILRAGREWKIALPPDESLVETIRHSLDCSRPFAVLLAQRGGDAWERLIDPDRSSFHSPFGLPDMERAILRVTEAIERGEKVFIHGDFDADGLSGAAVLYRGLRPLFPKNSIKVEVGDRLSGHGVSHPFVMRAIDEGFSLVITVDCGIGNHDEIAELGRAGIDTIVTDHHLPSAGLPPAVAIVNPHRPDSDYPNRHLAGVGVAYKLIEGLYTHLDRPAPRHLLDLVALGTIADLVPLASDGDSENRAIIREGFSLIAEGEGSSLGIRELLSRFSINPKKVTTSDIGYLVAPKLNAANRAGDPKVAFLLLITEDPQKAAYLAEILLDYNRDREIAQNDLLAQAEGIIRSEGIDPRDSGFVFLVGDYWNEGILGLVASNLTERYRVPSIVLSRGERISRGSCRSIGDFDVSACLKANADLLLQYGGHRMAAGFSIANDAIPKLEERLESYIAAHRSEITALAPERIDTATDLSEIDLRLYTELSSLAPYGPGNPPPSFLIRGCRFQGMTLVGNRRQHLKGRILQGERSLPFIAFRMGRYLSRFEETEGSSLICRIGFDDWQGSVQVQGIDLVAD